MVKDKPPVALIAGPTASGKSELALRLAEKARGIVINADSAQIYRDLPILSAAPSPSDMARAPHRLYGIRDGADACSAADWATMARKEIDRAHDKGQLPILVGGTGLYLRTLIDGIAPVPAIDPDIRAAVRAASVGENHAALTLLDPVAAQRLNPGDTTRVARALEVVRSTGRTLSDWQSQLEGGIGDEIDLRPVILIPPRPWLNVRCDQRFASMVYDGAVEEVVQLLQRHLDTDLPVMRAIGVPELSALIRGDVTQAQAIAAGQLATRRYAKRQYTWFAHQPPPHWQRLDQPLDSGAFDTALAMLAATG